MARLVRYDWCSPTGAVIIGGLAFLLRIPFCLAGPGFDGDSYLSLIMAMRTRASGDYFPSRGPGYIIPDHITQLLAPYGWVYLNLLNSFISALTVPVFAAILRATEARYRQLLIWLYALLPYPLVAYADVMIEYSLAVLHFLLGWLMVIRGRHTVAAALWGVGAAMRPSQGAFALLMFLFACARFYGWRQGVRSAIVSVGMLALLWLLPARWLTGSWQIITRYELIEFQLVPWAKLVAIQMVAQIGILPIVAIGYLVWKSGREIWQQVMNNFGYTLSVLVALITLLLFLRHPMKTNYLLLGVPFWVYLLSATSNAFWVKLTTTALLLQGIVSIPSSPPHGTNQPVGIGVPFANFAHRHIFRDTVAELVRSAPNRSVTVCAEGTLWCIEYEYIQRRRAPFEVHRKAIYDPARDRWFLWTRDADSLKSWIERGYSVRITPTLYKMLQPNLQQAGLHRKVRVLEIPRGI